jgi:hypothetical protein
MPKKRGRAAAGDSPATAPPPHSPPPQAGALDDPLLQSMDTDEVLRLARFLNAESWESFDDILEGMPALLHGSEPLTAPQQRRGGSDAGLASAKGGKAPPGRARALRVAPDASDDDDNEEVDEEVDQSGYDLDELLRERSGESAQTAALLLAAGADVHGVDADGNTAPHWAAHSGGKGYARELLRAGAAVDARAGDGWTPLMLAARQSDLALVRLLLAHGAR